MVFAACCPLCRFQKTVEQIFITCGDEFLLTRSILAPRLTSYWFHRPACVRLICGSATFFFLKKGAYMRHLAFQIRLRLTAFQWRYIRPLSNHPMCGYSYHFLCRGIPKVIGWHILCQRLDTSRSLHAIVLLLTGPSSASAVEHAAGSPSRSCHHI